MSLYNQRIVLHIDDDEDDRMMVEETIRELDPAIIVRQAGSGESGIAFLKQSKHFNDLPCLVILDLNMPVMDGKKVLSEIKKDPELASIPLVIFTTSPAQLDKDFASAENVELITKPSTTKDFFNSVKKMLAHCSSKEYKGVM